MMLHARGIRTPARARWFGASASPTSTDVRLLKLKHAFAGERAGIAAGAFAA